jgi:hypothetical protein
MALDTSRLRRAKLGSPPTDGAPGIEMLETQPDNQPASAAYVLTQEDAVPSSAPPTKPARKAVHERVPLNLDEQRVPFTTRVTVSTKDRLENACFHLRRKHQDFINEAIQEYLSKHGF